MSEQRYNSGEYIKGRTYKEWCEAHRERLRELNNKHYEKSYANPVKREQEKARRKRWAEEHKDQVRAMQRINYYIKKGAVKHEPCEVCGRLETHAHHDDYTRPLKVRWLCPVHHADWHKKHTPKRGEVNKEQTKKDKQELLKKGKSK